jgi:hypothetical protein
MKTFFNMVPVLVAAASLAGAQTPEVQIRVQADQVIHPVSRLLTGACIEDVNHEIYGGLYSQMIFGESFQEPAPSLPPKDFIAYGGQWPVQEKELHFSGSPGDKLVSQLAPFTDGEVGVEVYIADRSWSNVGLLLRVANAAAGVDRFDGYEIAVNAADQTLRLGRHRQNWELIKDTPCEVPARQWVSLAVKLNGKTLEVFLNGRSVVRHEDGDGALLTGTVGLRAFQREARYRDLWVKQGEELKRLPFVSIDRELGEVSGMWRPVRRGSATGTWAIEKMRPFLGTQSQQVGFTGGLGEVGVENQGLNRWGVHLVAGKSYEGLLWARAEKPCKLWVALESADGAMVHGEKKLELKTGDWQRLHFSLTPKSTETKGRFSIKLKEPGAATLGYAFLQPGKWGRFKNLPVRRDVAEGLVDQGITVLRYGGSMINDPDYRWKKMIGPRDRRPPYHGTWYAHSSNGWGILDFMDFCEAAGFEYIPAFYMGESPQDMVDFIEYAKGSAASEWGRKRVADGHPEPYRLHFVELGNEERVDEKYAAGFEALARAIWAKDPDLILVVGDFVYGERIQDPFNFRGAASGITSLSAQQRILKLAREKDREVWFDLHVGTDGPRPDSTFEGMFSFKNALAKLAEGARHKVVVFEFNAGNHSQQRALANALAIQAIERDGLIPIATSANCLQPDGQNDNGWDQGLLFLNPSLVWLQPPGYVTRMLAQNYLPQLVRCELTGPTNALDVNAKRSQNGKALLVQVVNPGPAPVVGQLHLGGFVPRRPLAQVTQLSAPLDAVNTAGEPCAWIPKHSFWRHGASEGNSSQTFPPHSFTLLRFQ